MKQSSYTFLSQLLCIFLLLGLVACGGKNDKTPTITYNLDVDTTEINFSQYRGETLSAPHTIKINYQGQGVIIGFAPGTQFAPWLSFKTEKIDDQNTLLYIDVQDTQFVDSGNFSTKIRVSTGDLTNSQLISHDIEVNLAIWRLDPSIDKLVFSATFGADSITEKSFDVTADATQWSAASDVDWLTIDNTTGTELTTVTVTPNIAGFKTSGLYQGNIVFTEQTTGDTRSFPVEIALDDIRLFADDAAVAFSQTNNSSKTSQVIEIRSNSLTDVLWQASADVAWLTTEKTNNKLTISIANNNLTSGIHHATVTIASTNSEAAESETIAVSFFKSSSIENKSITLTQEQYLSSSLVIDPLRPYLYVAKNNDLITLNLYTGAIVKQITTPITNGSIQSIVMHPRGHQLLVNVKPEVPEEGSNRDLLVRYAIPEQVFISEVFVNDQPLEYNPTAYIRFNGLYFIVSNALEFANESFERVSWDPANAFLTSNIKQPANKTSLYALNGQTQLSRYTATTNSYLPNSLSVGRTHTLTFASDADSAIFDFYPDLTDENIYLASADTEWLTFDGTTFADMTTLHGQNTIRTFDTAISDEGLVYFLRVNNELNYFVDKYDQHQTLLNNQDITQSNTTQLLLSADGQRLITVRAGETAEHIVLQFDKAD